MKTILYDNQIIYDKTLKFKINKQPNYITFEVLKAVNNKITVF